jgi:Zn-dependent peptidase ImmA (M78 family)
VPKPNLRRGFVSEAHWWSDSLRDEMKLAAHAPLCPKALCKHLGVSILLLSKLPPCPERDLLLAREKGHWLSAAVCFDRTEAFILLNDANEVKRQASDIAHELAHILLGHKPVNPFANGMIREFSPVDEQEAEILGPTLLVSEKAALLAYRLIQNRQHTLTSLSESWGITEQVIRMRMNAVGASKRIKRAA